MKQVCLLLCVIAAAAAAVPARLAAGVEQIAPEPLLPGEWFVAKTDAEVMAAAAEVLRQMGVTLARRDRAAGVLVTRRAEYGASWPAAAVLGLPATHQPTAATLHIFVAPGFRPARLAVGAILETDTTFAPLAGRRGRGETRMYGERHLGAAMAERIAATLQTPLVPMPYDPVARSREAARLGDATAARCGTASLVTREARLAGPAPRLVSQVKPVYPGNEDRQRVTGTVVLAAEVTEHGTLTGLTRQGGAERPNLVAAASGAAGLWRFRAASGDCPVRRAIGIEMAFLMP